MKEDNNLAQKAYVANTIALAKKQLYLTSQEDQMTAINNIYEIWQKKWISTAEATEILQSIVNKPGSSAMAIEKAQKILFKIACEENKI